MKKTKFAKLVSLVLALALCASVGMLAACEATPAEKHTWATTYSMDETNHWYQCLDLNCKEVKDEAAHTPDAEGVCSVCGYTPDAGGNEKPEEKQVTIYFYNYNGWTLGVTAADIEDGEDVLGGAEATAVEGHDNWYQVIVPVDVNKVNFAITFADTAEGADEGDTVTVTIIDEENVYISENGTYTSFADAEANPPIPMYQTVLHLQKPADWTGTQGVAVYVYTGGGDNQYLGAWPNVSNTHSDAEVSGWLAVEINMPEANKGTTVNFIVFDVENNDELTGAGRMTGSFSPADDIYVTADAMVFNNYNDVEVYLGGQAPAGHLYVTVHIEVKFGEGGIPAGGDVYLYAWGNPNNDQFGGWPGTKLEAEGGNWYTARILVTEEAYNAKDFHLIVNNGSGMQYDFVIYSGTLTEYWVSADQTVSDTAPTNA